MITVKRRAHSHDDRSGDPLDGLVNMFDVGIVLSLGFLIAALSSLQLADAFTEKGVTDPDQITVEKDAEVKPVPDASTKVVGSGTQVGTVYRLEDGRLIYVLPKPGVSGTPAAMPSAPPAP